MATGFFARVSQLWRGFASLWISNAEKNHPEIAYENAINSMVGKYAQLKSATAALIRRREDLAQRLTGHERELAQINQDLNVAVETNQDDLAVVLIQKKNQLEQDGVELKRDTDAAVTESEAAKASLMQVQVEIRKLRSEKDSMLAKLKSSQARVRIQEQLEGFSVENEVKALEGVREHIKNQVAQANLGKELAESSVDARLSALRAQSGDVSARQQLEQLKANSAAQRSMQAQKKTM